MYLRFHRDFRSWRTGGLYEVSDGVANVLIRRGVCVADVLPMKQREATPAAKEDKRKPIRKSN